MNRSVSSHTSVSAAHSSSSSPARTSASIITSNTSVLLSHTSSPIETNGNKGASVSVPMTSDSALSSSKVTSATTVNKGKSVVNSSSAATTVTSDVRSITTTNPSEDTSLNITTSKTASITSTSIRTQTNGATNVVTSVRTSQSDSPVSKVTSIVTETGKWTSSTSTIVDHPESTFSTPVSITVVENGKSSLSVPPLVTVFSTTSESNGSVLTFTHIIANPTGFIGGMQDTRDSSFLSNGGKVAGVFVVVGVIAATLFLFAYLAFRRRRNEARRRRRWIAGIQRPLPLPPDPFEDPREVPPMMQIDDHDWNQRRDIIADNPSLPHPHDGPSIGLGLTGIEPQKPEGPFSDLYACDTNEVGLAISTGPVMRRRSFAQSSPSLYPPTLPADDVGLVGEDVGPHLSKPELAGPQSLPDGKTEHKVPPRPPRSPFREGPVKYVYPITPPSSASSHEHDSPTSKPPTPELYKFPSSAFFTGQPTRSKTSQDDVLARPTLLDVRHRSSESPPE